MAIRPDIDTYLNRQFLAISAVPRRTRAIILLFYNRVATQSIFAAKVGQFQLELGDLSDPSLRFAAFKRN